MISVCTYKCGELLVFFISKYYVENLSVFKAKFLLILKL